MRTLTTRQRDLLYILLNANKPLPTAEMAARLHLTPRQVTYGLKGLEQWLARRNVRLVVTPGVGVVLKGSPAQCNALVEELAAQSRFQLILSIEQRQQLLALVLLATDSPFILLQLQQLAQVSRTTILKDLDGLSSWLAQHFLVLKRRPNYGVWIEGTERARREALAAWLWGETPLERPLTQMTHTQGLSFSLNTETSFLPLVQKASQIIHQYDTARTFSQVAFAEAQLNGRFTDDAVLFLALTFAIQANRIQHGHFLNIDKPTINWLQTLSVWPVAQQIANRLNWHHHTPWPNAEIAAIAMHLLSAPRNERWPGDLEIDTTFASLVEDLMQYISQAYNLPELSDDATLRDGLITYLVPTCLRHRFNLWLPEPEPAAVLSEKYIFEHNLARDLATKVAQKTAVTLTQSETNHLALLLRAAYIRKRPNQIQEVLVVCPSGMATAQLLVARLKARFPRLKTFKVVSLRQLTPATIDQAELIITTVPLSTNIEDTQKVIQVHPLLLPEDIETIIQWLA